MNIEITKQEAWKLLDAIEAYKKDYSLTAPVTKMFTNIAKKLKDIVSDS